MRAPPPERVGFLRDLRRAQPKLSGMMRMLFSLAALLLALPAAAQETRRPSHCIAIADAAPQEGASGVSPAAKDAAEHRWNLPMG